MVLVVRGEIRLTAGKAAVQVAHAAVQLVEQAIERGRPELGPWRVQGQKKIVLVAPTLADLQQIERHARGMGVLTALVQDAGLTEVAPGTVTCLGLGPALAVELDPLTGTLPLL